MPIVGFADESEKIFIFLLLSMKVRIEEAKGDGGWELKRTLARMQK